MERRQLLGMLGYGQGQAKGGAGARMTKQWHRDNGPRFQNARLLEK